MTTFDKQQEALEAMCEAHKNYVLLPTHHTLGVRLADATGVASEAIEAHAKAMAAKDRTPYNKYCIRCDWELSVPSVFDLCARCQDLKDAEKNYRLCLDEMKDEE